MVHDLADLPGKSAVLMKKHKKLLDSVLTL